MYCKYPNQIKRLSKYKYAKRDYLIELRNLEELETVLFKSTIPVSSAKVKTTPKADRISDRMDKYSQLQKRCKEKSQKAIAEMQKVLKLIDLVETAVFKEILIKRYIHTLRWEQIAVDLNYDYSHVSRLHNKAIEEMMRNEKA